jgi:hypothetical protein
MKNYRVLPSCANCKHVYVVSDYDCTPQLYCEVNKDRPPCTDGGNGRDEVPIPNSLHDKEAWAKHNVLEDEWRLWAEAHCVWDNGVCDLHERRQE